MMVVPSIGMNMQQRIQRTPSPDRRQRKEERQNEERDIPGAETRLGNGQIGQRDSGQQPEHDFDICYIPFHD